VGLAACMGQKSVLSVLKKTGRSETSGSSLCVWNGNMNRDLKEIVWEGVPGLENREYGRGDPLH
jgi:hypothetical protein